MKFEFFLCIRSANVQIIYLVFFFSIQKHRREQKKIKEVKHYICDVCGTEYSEKAQCQKCKKSYVRPLEFADIKYRPVTVDETGAPYSITVELSNGKKATYKRLRMDDEY